MMGRRRSTIISVRYYDYYDYYYLSRRIIFLVVSFCFCFCCCLQHQQQVVYSFQLYPSQKMMPMLPPQLLNTRIIASTTSTSLFIKTTGFLPPPPPSTRTRLLPSNDSIRLYSSPPSEEQQDTTSSRNNKSGKTTTKTTKTFTIYKDDCFGFITFLAGIGMKDIIFLGIFVILSLLADVATRLDYLPPDPKRPTIVDRKIPGIIAAITLTLTPIITSLIFVVEGGSSNIIIPEPSESSYARLVQLAVCSFSMITSFLDIRWRDRFDYPEEY